LHRTIKQAVRLAKQAPLVCLQLNLADWSQTDPVSWLCCRGGRYQGHKKTEKFLPVGAIVTVVGELARNSISTGAGMNLFRCVCWGVAGVAGALLRWPIVTVSAQQHEH
jgi:hypothetical protein